MKKQIKVPKFENEDQEREFWSKINLSEYINASDLEPVSFPNLKSTSEPISIRIPQHILRRVKEKANALDIPYQSLIKIYLADRVRDNASEKYKVK